MLLVVAAGLFALYSWYKRYFENWNSQFLTYVLVGVGSVFLSFPIILSSYLSDYDYRMWIIQGPDPFDKMGSGPFLIGKAAGWLIIDFGLIICAVIFLIGFLCIIVGDATAWTSPIVAIGFYA